MVNRRTKIILIFLTLLFFLVLIYCLYNASRHSSSLAEQDVQCQVLGEVFMEESDQTTWMELPASSKLDEDKHVITHKAEMDGVIQRNYTIMYDEELYAALWVAYPLCASHTAEGREETWDYDPKVSKSAQTSVKSGYGASVPTLNYPKNFYARGHQIPNADRSAVPQMQAQTYYSTNMTPQLQNGFNGNIWARLEEAVRMEIPEGDTLYVVTGAVFEKHGQSEQVRSIVNKNDSKNLPVPNYYWKALLKVKRVGGSVTDASSIGFWLPHADLKGHSYTDYAVSVDQIESWTGFDMFPSLPDAIESSVESVDDWISFHSF